MIENSLDDVYICIDTSGSIDNKTLGIFFRMLEDLLKKYKTCGEVIYWGTNIEATYKFKNWKELVTSKPVGGGGTDVNKVFEYFESRDFKIGKKKKPVLILILTDGCFYSVNDKYKKWNKQTVWLIEPKYIERFKEPFGIKAALKGDKENAK